MSTWPPTHVITHTSGDKPEPRLPPKQIFNIKDCFYQSLVKRKLKNPNATKRARILSTSIFKVGTRSHLILLIPVLFVRNRALVPLRNNESNSGSEFTLYLHDKIAAHHSSRCILLCQILLGETAMRSTCRLSALFPHSRTGLA